LKPPTITAAGAPARTAAPLLSLSLLLGSVACSKHEFNDPTTARATIVYDHTGTAQGVSQQFAPQPPANAPERRNK
jgi:hypothetical protein